MAEATPKQLSFINELRQQRVLTDAAKARISARIAGGLDKDTASTIIKWLLDQPKAARQPQARGTVQVTEPGVYENERGIFVVKPNKAKTNLYAMRVVESNSARLNADGDYVAIDFVYDKGAIFGITPEDKMDVERAKALTIRYGRCINCGRKLTAAKSVEQGIGPVCIKAFAMAPAPAREVKRPLAQPAKAPAKSAAPVNKPARQAPATFAELAARRQGQ